jgi:hypothetical protein
MPCSSIHRLPDTASCAAANPGSTTTSRPVMLGMPPGGRPAHERYAAAAKRVQRRITLALESGDYDKVRTLSATLQAIVRKAAESKGDDAMQARARRRRP